MKKFKIDINSLLDKGIFLNNTNDLDYEKLMDIISQNFSYYIHEEKNHTQFHDNDNNDNINPNDFYCGGKLEEIVISYGYNYHAYVSIFVCLFGTIANILNIAVLTRKDMVCTPINRILTGLAVADMLLMIEYIPFAYYYHLKLLQGDRDFPYLGAVYVFLHNHVTQVLHTISICLTLTLAIWRYLAIRYPQRNHILCSLHRCTIAISLSYILPLVMCIPSYFTLKIKATNVLEDKIYTLYHTTLSDLFRKNLLLLQINFWIYGVFIKLLPCCILTVISYWLISTLLSTKKRKQVLRSYQSYLLSEPGCSGNNDVKITKAERRADRTTKMLIAVLLLFLLTEFPQGILAFVIGIKGKDFFLGCYQNYGDLMDILALLNGAINFILYCCMNRMFRVNFGMLFKRKILAKWRPAIPSDHTTTPNITNTTEI